MSVLQSNDSDMKKRTEDIYETFCGMISDRHAERQVENTVNSLYGRPDGVSTSLDNLLYERFGMSGADIFDTLYKPHIKF